MLDKILNSQTFADFLDNEFKFTPGNFIQLKSTDGNEPRYSFWVGDCTPFHEPSDNDGGFRWDDFFDEYGDRVVERVIDANSLIGG